MKLGTRFFCCFFIIFTIGFFYPIDLVLQNLRTRYLEGVEEPLVDQANIMAAWIGIEMEKERLNPDDLHLVFDAAYQRDLAARIYNLEKSNVDQQVYITDQRGIVLFDSENKAREGSNFSHWRDVAMTLHGKYGARTTKKDEKDLESSVLYVAAPIYVNNRLAGVLTVGKPTTNINRFLKSAKPQIIKVGLISLAIVILLSSIIIFWLTLPIKRLTRYANNIRDGMRNVAPPSLGRSEIGELGQAFEEMKEALEGQNYIESYVQTLTHELKSPLSAIGGAAELLEENMPTEKRSRFLANIRNEIARIQRLVDRMLALSALENQKKLQQTKQIILKSLMDRVFEDLRPMAQQKQLTILNQIAETAVIAGDPFLIKLALSNLLLNAIDFSPPGARIEIQSIVSENYITVCFHDTGPGIPVFAQDKIFEKFYSLQRPASGKKSTGLGLNFVREVADLHHGSIEIKNRNTTGATAELKLPRSSAFLGESTQ